MATRPPAARVRGVAGASSQEDPIGLAGGTNLYGFAAGDPVNYSDPFGLCPYGPATGWASLRCALEDLVGAVKASPRLLAQAVRDVATNEFAGNLASIPFTFVGGGGGAITKGGSALAAAARAADRAFITSERLGHIVARHGFGSAARDAGKFAKSADIEGLVKQALKSDATLIKPDPLGKGFRFEHTFTSPIGVSREGNVTSSLRVVVNPNGKVVTAYPF